MEGGREEEEGGGGEGGGGREKRVQEVRETDRQTHAEEGRGGEEKSACVPTSVLHQV
jgi:hypothetical protein